MKVVTSDDFSPYVRSWFSPETDGYLSIVVTDALYYMFAKLQHFKVRLSAIRFSLVYLLEHGITCYYSIFNFIRAEISEGVERDNK